MDKTQLQVKVTSLRGQMNDIVELSKKEKRDLNAAEAEKFDTLKAELESTKRNIDRLVTMENETRSNPTVAVVNPDLDPDNPLDVPEKDLSRYDLMRAIRCIIKNRPVDGLEGEISQEIQKRSRRSAQGFYMYTGAVTRNLGRSFVPSFTEGRAFRSTIERRDLTTSTGVGGINQTVLFQSFIDILRHKTVIDKIGTRFMAGLVGKFYIPRQSGKGTTYWLGEEGTPTASNQTIDNVELQPNTLGAYTDISRQFIEQTSLDAEAFVRDDLSKNMAIEIDRAALCGDGTANSPTGILYNTDISHLQRSISGGSILSWSDVVGMEATLEEADALLGDSLAYVTNPKVKSLLKTTLRTQPNVAAPNAKFIWDDDGEVNSYKAFASNNVPSNIGAGDTESNGDLSTIMFGNWNDLIVAMWGGLDILVDPYSRSTAGAVRIVALQDIDIKVRHPESFVTIDDVLAG